MKDFAVGKLVMVKREGWLKRYMASDKCCDDHEGQETSPGDTRYSLPWWSRRLSIPTLIIFSHILVPQIWATASEQVRSKRGTMWQTLGDKWRKGHRAGRSSQWHCKLCPHSTQKESIFMQISQKAKGQAASWRKKITLFHSHLSLDANSFWYHPLLLE